MDTIELVAFAHESAARLLISFLKSHNIETRYEYHAGEFSHQVVLLDPSYVHDAAFLVKEFVDNPDDPKYQQIAWQQEEQVSLTNKHSGLPKFNLQTITQAPFMWAVFVICILVYGLSLFGGYAWVDKYLKILELQQLVDTAQWWRLFTPAFIHFSELHIIFNLLWWWSLGRDIEKRFGTSTLVILFVVSALISNVGQLLVTGPDFGGLSGVVYAIIGFVWWCGWLRPQWGLGLPKMLVAFLLFWLVLGYADLLWVQMANAAHTLGLVSGCALSLCYAHFTKK
ncbi:rhomboid family intramembrane serine protease GlpG [Aliiglaciecola sp. LCG003]|uniref:rhomboid family intramembrane serine protease GlpG n=1 Tax=Aliiglaciecola sp. LCG003 TaxID=3053655 RepID=UPI002572A8AC|nr:rhomboid family intramembrane serine protease GlpG [Aliiglaciecola sp. LCG003]WJG09523.1 rhomboid family intramembrane serine protease GlpG [Aliiglaciecola sp. LCG003]